MTTIEALSRKEAHVGVVGLGYVGRPLAAALHRHFSVYGFDTDARLIRALRGEAGATRAPHPDAGRLRGMGDRLTADPAVLGKCSFIVVTVPTPITADRVPDLTPLRAAARSIGRNLKLGCVVVLESTVYPGVTEEVIGRSSRARAVSKPAAGFIWATRRSGSTPATTRTRWSGACTLRRHPGSRQPVRFRRPPGSRRPPALVELRGIGLLTGEPGGGKTTVCRAVTATLHPGLHRVLYVSLTTGNVMDM